MEKELEKLVIRVEEEEDDVINVPYYFVTYVDDWNRTHMATVKEEWYLRFLEDRYYVKDCKYVGEENLDKIEK